MAQFKVCMTQFKIEKSFELIQAYLWLDSNCINRLNQFKECVKQFMKMFPNKFCLYFPESTQIKLNLIQMVKWIDSCISWFDSWKFLNTLFSFCLLESSQCKIWSNSKGLNVSFKDGLWNQVTSLWRLPTIYLSNPIINLLGVVGFEIHTSHPLNFSYSIQMVKWINLRQTWFDSWKCLNTQFLFCLLESSQCKAWSDSKGLKDSIQGWLDMIHMMILFDSNWVWSIHFSIIWIDLWTILID